MVYTACSTPLHGIHTRQLILVLTIFWYPQFHKHIADGWNCYVPYCCTVNVIAHEGPDTATYINHLVLLKGIAGEERCFSICETFQTRGKADVVVKGVSLSFKNYTFHMYSA